jgi:hypothetical protein
LEITSVDQSNPRIEKFFINQTYVNNALGHPFNKIQINNFYIHFDYSTIRMGEIQVEDGRDIWEYGMSPKEIFYRVFGTTPFHSGYLEFDYLSKDGSRRSMKFIIEDDGLETLQLRSTGIWPNNQFGEKQTMTLFLTRVGP